MAEPFERVVVLHGSVVSAGKRPGSRNLLRMAIAFRGTGNSGTAMHLAKRVVGEVDRAGLEFNCWRHHGVTARMFREDMGEPLSFVEERKPRDPLFIRAKSKASAEPPAACK